jgi:hypothetical protein
MLLRMDNENGPIMERTPSPNAFHTSLYACAAAYRRARGRVVLEVARQLADAGPGALAAGGKRLIQQAVTHWEEASFAMNLMRCPHETTNGQ